MVADHSQRPPQRHPDFDPGFGWSYSLDGACPDEYRRWFEYTSDAHGVPTASWLLWRSPNGNVFNVHGQLLRSAELTKEQRLAKARSELLEAGSQLAAAVRIYRSPSSPRGQFMIVDRKLDDYFAAHTAFMTERDR